MDVRPVDGGYVKINQTGASIYPATYTLASGSPVRLEAVPADGYSFTGWSGAQSGNDNPTILLLDCDKRVIANFSPNETDGVSKFHWSYIPIAIAVLVILGIPSWFIIRKG